MKSSVFEFIMNLYPPYLGTGIRVQRVTGDYREIDVQMGLHWYNRNYVDTHFGGNLSSMTDPFYMLMNIHERDYRVWDKSGTIDFIKPAKGTVKAHFCITQAMIDEVLEATAVCDKYLSTLSVDIVDQEGATVARVGKALYVRRKKSAHVRHAMATAERVS